MPSFDVVCKPNLGNCNAVDQANKEISNRFDFKGSDARFELKELDLTAYADDDFKLGQVRDVLMGKLAKRGVDPRLLDFGKPEKIGGDKLKQVVTVRNGIDSVLARKIVAMIKESKLKVSSSIQGDAVRVAGAKRDTLQVSDRTASQGRHRSAARRSRTSATEPVYRTRGAAPPIRGTGAADGQEMPWRIKENPSYHLRVMRATPSRFGSFPAPSGPARPRVRRFGGPGAAAKHPGIVGAREQSSRRRADDLAPRGVFRARRTSSRGSRRASTRGSRT